MHINLTLRGNSNLPSRDPYGIILLPPPTHLRHRRDPTSLLSLNLLFHLRRPSRDKATPCRSHLHHLRRSRQPGESNYAVGTTTSNCYLSSASPTTNARHPPCSCHSSLDLQRRTHSTHQPRRPPPSNRQHQSRRPSPQLLALSSSPATSTYALIHHRKRPRAPSCTANPRPTNHVLHRPHTSAQGSYVPFSTSVRRAAKLRTSAISREDAGTA